MNRHCISIAPMMECTDRHYRYFMRLITSHVLLYTEMITVGAILNGETSRFLSHDPIENPLAIQLGGSDPKELAQSAKMAADFAYEEINLNVGCPSARVRSGEFGASLFRTPKRVANCVSAMQDAVDIPVTVKTRIGVDDHDRYEDLVAFVSEVAKTGCHTFIIHARKAWLSGLNS